MVVGFLRIFCLWFGAACDGLTRRGCGWNLWFLSKVQSEDGLGEPSSPFVAWLGSGLFDAAWDEFFLGAIDCLREKLPKRDFLFRVSRSRPLGYTKMLAQNRRCLVVHAGLSPEEASWFTLHSLKTTLLAWSNQLNVADSFKSAQGHHRVAFVSRCMPQYGRDDIINQLRCQKQVLQTISAGWAPYVLIDRGTGHLVLPSSGSSPATAEASAFVLDEESDCESVSSACPSDESVIPSASDDEAVPKQYLGPWILNCVTGFVHKAVSTDDGASWVLACRPHAVLHDGHEIQRPSLCALDAQRLHIDCRAYFVWWQRTHAVCSAQGRASC